MLRLTDDQLSAVWTAALPLARGQRGVFLQDVAALLLQGHSEIGDGDVSRTIYAIAQRYGIAPELKRA